MADIKVKLRCSQEQFVDMLQKYYTQQLVQLEDPDAVPDWVMLSFRNELSQIFKDFKGYPKITQGQWIRILKTALQDAQDGWPSECIPLPQPAQPAQPAKSDTFDATLSKFQDMEKELNAQPDHEVMEVPDKVLWTQKGGKGRYQLQPNDPPQEHNGWSQEVVQRYYTEVLRMDPLPWGAFVAPQFRQAQFKPPEPDPPAGFSAATASSSTGKGSGRPHQPFNVLDAALSNMQRSSVWKPQPIRTANDAQGYVKSELQKLNINEIDKLLDSSESDQKLSDLDNVPDLIEDMKSKILLLEQALESQELTMLRLRQHAKNMEEEQGELRALHAELQLSVKRSQSYWEQKLSQDLLNKVVALTAEMADIKVKLRCSQEQFVDMLQKYYTQQLVQLEDPDAVPDWVMLSFRNELSQIFKDFKGYPKITQGQWIRILKTALQDAQDMEKELNAQPDHEVMEVPDKVLWTQKGGQGRYQLQPNDPPQEHNGWSQEVVQRYYTEVLRMDPLPWGAFVAPQFRQAQFKPPEPDPPAGFSAATASSSTGKGSGRPHQPFNVLDAALSNMQRSSVWKPQPIRTANDAQGYVKSELQKLNINEIDKLLDSSESDQKLSDLDNVPDLIEDMKFKILLLEQALESQELTMLRLRQHAKNMEEEQGELRALHAELQLSVKRSQSYWEQKLSQDLLNKEALRKFMETHQMSELDLRQLMQKSPQIDHKPQDSVKEVVDV
ncbi:unnamed protein product [Cladocopium goreaui]|uniref:Uncharacterized protein n=1 Tax=Cladocopium goreaui TaxID=2562237 RepID=A0A9P1C9G6_9DINO|nr:unnamed protein product [Cladocopium goreaui]